MTEFFLQYNYGYKWFSDKESNIYVKGVLFLDNLEKLEGNDLVEFLKSQDIVDFPSFEQVVSKWKGFFLVIIRTETDVFIAADSTRTFPLFYTVRNNKIHITDMANHLREIYKTAIEKNHVEEFLSTGYVTENATLLNGVFQLQAGEIGHFSFHNSFIKTKFYADYLPSQLNEELNEEVLSNDFLGILENALTRLLQFSKERTLVLPLSGGYDSRLIACMLKEKGVENVICYTYGAIDSPEVLTSKKVAEQLGFKWHFIEYNSEIIDKELINDEQFKEYYNFAANHVSVFFLQDFFAVKHLKDNKMIPDNAVIVPGHSGDFIAGSHLSKTDIENKSRKRTIQQIAKKHFILNNKGCENSIFFENLKEIACDYEYAIDDDWNLKERQAKFIVNSVRIYEFFGYQHYLVLWDRELVNFFKNLAPEYKLNCRFYVQTIFEFFFEPLGVAFKKKEKNLFKELMKRLLSSLLPKKLYQKIKRSMKLDFNKMNLMEEPFLLDIQKDKNDFANINGVLAHWYIFQLKNNQ